MKTRLIAAALLTLSLSGCVIDAAALNNAAWYQPTPSYGYQSAPSYGYQPAPSYGYQPSLSYGNVYYGGQPRQERHHHGYH
ncbi:hypothetical protein [Paramagnetospirillum kuznetsovii]|uniref:hypothetical protein n=1 Tax=Paramagnetospirillum kuznetsovii TaxID=2053833 RepID=UPI00195FCF7D|nr:hypothetical protein [Paramagnetospirillum kuznetsovii]